MAVFVGSVFSGDLRLDEGKVSSGALTSGALALLLAVGALREGALDERAGALPAFVRFGAASVSVSVPCDMPAPAPPRVLSCADTEDFFPLAADLADLGWGAALLS